MKRRNDRKEQLCYRCYQKGHFINRCKNPRACRNCHSTGHLAFSRDCPKHPSKQTAQENQIEQQKAADIITLNENDNNEIVELAHTGGNENLAEHGDMGSDSTDQKRQDETPSGALSNISSGTNFVDLTNKEGQEDLNLSTATIKASQDISSITENCSKEEEKVEDFTTSNLVEKSSNSSLSCKIKRGRDALSPSCNSISKILRVGSTGDSNLEMPINDEDSNIGNRTRSRNVSLSKNGKL